MKGYRIENKEKIFQTRIGYKIHWKTEELYSMNMSRKERKSRYYKDRHLKQMSNDVEKSPGNWDN